MERLLAILVILVFTAVVMGLLIQASKDANKKIEKKTLNGYIIERVIGNKIEYFHESMIRPFPNHINWVDDPSKASIFHPGRPTAWSLGRAVTLVENYNEEHPTYLVEVQVTPEYHRLGKSEFNLMKRKHVND